jgi:hypothetical protein
MMDRAHNCRAAAICLTAGRDFGLKAKDIPLLDANIRQRLFIEQLLARSTVVEFVTERLTVGSELGEFHFLQQNGQKPVDRRIVGHFDLLSLVARGVPDFNRYHPHEQLSRVNALLV